MTEQEKYQKIFDETKKKSSKLTALSNEPNDYWMYRDEENPQWSIYANAWVELYLCFNDDNLMHLDYCWFSNNMDDYTTEQFYNEIKPWIEELSQESKYVSYMKEMPYISAFVDLHKDDSEILKKLSEAIENQQEELE